MPELLRHVGDRFAGREQFGHRHEFVALGRKRGDDLRQGGLGMPAAAVRVEQHDRARLGMGEHLALHCRCALGPGRIPGRDIPLDREQALRGHLIQCLGVAGAVGKAEQAEPLRRLLVRERAGARSGALLCLEFRANVFISELRVLDLVDERLSVQLAKVAMLPTVVGDFELCVGHQLLGTIAVRQCPLSTHEECRPDPVLAEEVDDAALIASNLERLLAEIECERDELLARRQLDPAHGATLHSRGEFGERALWRGNRLGSPMRRALVRLGGKIKRAPACGGRWIGLGRGRCGEDEEQCKGKNETHENSTLHTGEGGQRYQAAS